MKLKVCMIYNPMFSGARNLVSGLQKKGVDVFHVMSSSPPDDWSAKCIVVETGSAITMLKDLIRAKIRIAAFKPDIVHVIDAGMKTLWANLFSGRTPLVISPTGTDIREHDSLPLLARISQRLALCRSSYVLLNGWDQQADLEKLGVARSKIARLYFGVHPFKATLERGKVGRKEDVTDNLQGNVSGSPIRTVLAGHKFEKAYGPNLLASTIKRVLKQRDDVIFRIAGEGSMLGNVRMYLASFEDRVTFLGHLPHKEYLKELAAADIFLLATVDCNGVSIGLLEALLMGVPVVATDVGSYGEVAIDGVTALLKPSDENNLSDAMFWILDNYSSAKQLGKRATALIEQRALSTSSAERLMHIYERCIT